MQLLSRFFRKRSADNADNKDVSTLATTALTACQNEIGPCVDTLHSVNTPSQARAAKRRFDELSIHNDGQDTGSTAIDQSTKKPRGQPRSLVPAPAATRPQGRPRKTEEAAIAKSERAAQQAAEIELDDERARQLKEAEQARLEAERAPQRQLILDEQSQRMQFPPAKVYTTQTTLNFAPATTSPQTPFPDGSSAIPSASDASVSTTPTSRSIPTSVGLALPDDSDSFDSDPRSNMSGDPFDGDKEDDGGGSTKTQGRWEHPAWLTDLYSSRWETIKHANGSGANRSSKPFHQMLHGWLPTKTIWSQPEDLPAGSGLVCDKCQQTESTLKKGVLRRDSFLGRPRRACDLNNSVFLIGVSYRCNNKQCNKR
ncbi:BQ5605_C006g03829 [Microbotryum silenes-dioicae]|uniref:BQ5605_C006g03829 protein n=1 Tax=Microbotryum silenes-dioicae TaxID=796604 RepID=A0A2X0M552_9BASI|nr:BQ5605_C006g03829 [Microbotryum silenes-dioicae]